MPSIEILYWLVRSRDGSRLVSDQRLQLISEKIIHWKLLRELRPDMVRPPAGDWWQPTYNALISGLEISPVLAPPTVWKTLRVCLATSHVFVFPVLPTLVIIANIIYKHLILNKEIEIKNLIYISYWLSCTIFSST